MRAFLQASYPRFTGLTGDKAAIDAVRANYRVFAARRADPDDPEGYDMPHSALTYVVGPDGKLIAHFADTVEADKVLERLLELLPDGPPTA
jgi:protein SCO1/2